jgi:glycosyltransferase AcbS
MHIIEFYFNVAGFDYKFICGGIAVYTWNLAQQFSRSGHKVSMVMAAHGQIDYLKSKYEVEKLECSYHYTLPLILDSNVWKDFPSKVELQLHTEVYKLRLNDIEIYFLSNEYLNMYPDSFYPPYEVKGKDLSFFKPLVLQMDFIQFVQDYFKKGKCLIHAHEPFYQYLVPIVFKGDPDKMVISTVQSNMPINKKVYKPETKALLDFFKVDIDLSQFDDKIDDSDLFMRCVKQYLPSTHLFYDYPSSDYVSFYSMVLKYSDLIDFLSDGQKHFYSTFADTAFADFFQLLTVAKIQRENYHKYFVGWCAIPDKWIDGSKTAIKLDDRNCILRSLGLNPQYPTFYHNARYAVEHKGQVELMKAIDTVLGENLEVNFIIRCISKVGIDNPYFHEVIKKYPHNLYFEWNLEDEERLFQYVTAADYCLFPSKFEMDTFLIAQGEAMLYGAVPVATQQEGMRHWLHGKSIEDPDATGLAVARSFQEDDRVLVANLAEAIRKAVAIYQHNPTLYQRLTSNSQKVAQQFTWDVCAREHLKVMEPYYRGQKREVSLEELLENEWFDQMNEKMVIKYRERIRERLLETGNFSWHRKFFPGETDDYDRFFESAYRLGKFHECLAIIAYQPKSEQQKLILSRITVRQKNGDFEVEYSYPYAERIELFLANQDLRGFFNDSPVRKLKDFQGVFLKRENGLFTGRFSTDSPNPEMYFLLTLDNGRVVWDRRING